MIEGSIGRFQIGIRRVRANCFLLYRQRILSTRALISQGKAPSILEQEGVKGVYSNLMLEFHDITTDDLAAIKTYLPYSLSRKRFCDFTVGDIFMWRNAFATTICYYKDLLIVKKEYEKGKFAFLYPMGANPEEGLKAIDEYCLSSKELPAFYGIDAATHKELEKHYRHFHCLSDRGWSDYLYSLPDLRDLPGKKYDSKRHNVHSFWKKNPTVHFQMATVDDLPRFQSFEAAYLAENEGLDISAEEFTLAKEMLTNFSNIFAKLGYFELEGKIIGFTLGEIEGDTVFLHVEKALRSYPGIYQALESEFFRALPPEVLYVNREDDVNNAGLREAKLQLHPLEVMDKCFFEVTSSFDLLLDVPNLETERLSLGPLTEADQDEFACLSLDDINNRYWGYDYHYDLEKGAIADKTFFFQDYQRDFQTKNQVSLIIHDKMGHLLGEVALYDFGITNTCHMGVRLLPEAQKHGYAKEALKAVFVYLKGTLFQTAVYYECFLPNVSSLNLASALGFVSIGEDRLKKYFRLDF